MPPARRPSPRRGPALGRRHPSPRGKRPWGLRGHVLVFWTPAPPPDLRMRRCRRPRAPEPQTRNKHVTLLDRKLFGSRSVLELGSRLWRRRPGVPVRSLCPPRVLLPGSLQRPSRTSAVGLRRVSSEHLGSPERAGDKRGLFLDDKPLIVRGWGGGGRPGLALPHKGGQGTSCPSIGRLCKLGRWTAPFQDCGPQLGPQRFLGTDLVPPGFETSSKEDKGG